MAKKETFTRWDAAEYLKSEEDMALYLDAMIEESNGDPRMIAVALGDIAKARGMTQIAKDTGLARENLYKALSADGNPAISQNPAIAGFLLWSQAAAFNGVAGV